MLTSLHLHKKSSEVSIKTRSTPALLSIQGQDTKHTTVKWPIGIQIHRTTVNKTLKSFLYGANIETSHRKLTDSE